MTRDLIISITATQSAKYTKVSKFVFEAQI